MSQTSINFPHDNFPDDVSGNGTAAELAALMQIRGNKPYTEVKLEQSIFLGEQAGSFGQFQCLRGQKPEISISYIADGNGGGMIDGNPSRVILPLETRVSWVIHKAEN